MQSVAVPVLLRGRVTSIVGPVVMFRFGTGVLLVSLTVTISEGDAGTV